MVRGWIAGTGAALAMRRQCCLRAMAGAAEVADEESGVGVVAAYRPAAEHFSFARAAARRGRARADRHGRDGWRSRHAAGRRDTGRVSLRAASTQRTRRARRPTRFADTGPLGKLTAHLQQPFPACSTTSSASEGLAGSRGGEQCAAEGEAVKAIEVPILVPGRAHRRRGARPAARLARRLRAVRRVGAGGRADTRRPRIDRGPPGSPRRRAACARALLGRHHRRGWSPLRRRARGDWGGPGAARRARGGHEPARRGRTGRLARGTRGRSLAARELRASAAAHPRRRSARRHDR